MAVSDDGNCAQFCWFSCAKYHRRGLWRASFSQHRHRGTVNSSVSHRRAWCTPIRRHGMQFSTIIRLSGLKFYIRFWRRTMTKSSKLIFAMCMRMPMSMRKNISIIWCTSIRGSSRDATRPILYRAKTSFITPTSNRSLRILIWCVRAIFWWQRRSSFICLVFWLVEFWPQIYWNSEWIDIRRRRRRRIHRTIHFLSPNLASAQRASCSSAWSHRSSAATWQASWTRMDCTYFLGACRLFVAAKCTQPAKWSVSISVIRCWI